MMKYKAGYKYQLVEAEVFLDTGCIPVKDCTHDFLHLTLTGNLVVLPGYAWDGPSDPAVDTKNFMRASLAHDALYQLMRDGTLPLSFREAADRLLVRLCKEDGMSALRRAWVFAGVRLGGSKAASEPVKLWEAP